jgi:hypothetical protein
MPGDQMSRACAGAGRVLVLLSVVLLFVMPWTEYFWHFDQFPSAGDDFELSVFLLVTIFGLVLVLLQHGRMGVSFILGLKEWLSSVLQGMRSRVTEHFDDLTASFHAPPLPSRTSGSFNPPIRV